MGHDSSVPLSFRAQMDEAENFIILCREEVAQLRFQHERAVSILLHVFLGRIVSEAEAALASQLELHAQINALKERYIQCSERNAAYYQSKFDADTVFLRELEEDEFRVTLQKMQELNHRMMISSNNRLNHFYYRVLLLYALSACYCAHCLYICLGALDQEQRKSVRDAIADLGKDVLGGLLPFSEMVDIYKDLVALAESVDRFAVQDEFFDQLDSRLLLLEEQVDTLSAIKDMIDGYTRLVKEHEADDLSIDNIGEMP